MYRILLILLMIFLYPCVSFATEQNAGFVQGIWYSPEPVFENTPTRIYVALRNSTSHDLTGTVRFTDNGKRIGSSDISVLSGRLVEAWVDWIPTAGEHAITASVSDATLHIIGGGTEAIDIEGIVASSTRTIDIDTDKDGIGNSEDTDDDNDTVLDEEERTRGSNPLVAQPLPTTKDTGPARVPDTVPSHDIAKEEETTDREVGLEQYVDEGVADTLLGSATDKIERVKQSLDTYREERRETLKSKAAETPATQEASSIDSATITRTKIDAQNDFLASFVSGVSSLLSIVWTFILFITSGALARPALFELAILIGIIYLVYRTARRFGRRPGYKN